MKSTDEILKNIIWGIGRKDDFEKNKYNHSHPALCNGVYEDEDNENRKDQIKLAQDVCSRYGKTIKNY